MAAQQACLKMANVKGLVAILQGIKSSHKSQLCTMSINSDGVAVRWEDASKSLQSSVWLSSELFTHYNCPWARKALGLHFAQFVDTLNVFALGSGAELVLRFPGRNEELICEMVEDGSMAQLCTYARIDTVEIPFSGDLMDSWEDPTSFFLMDGALLKETVEDLEWPSGGLTVEAFLRRDPPQIQFSAHGLGDLRVTLPAAKLDGFNCASAEVRHSYKHKHLRTAFTQLPHIKDGSSPVSTKVSIDRDGLMKVTHMVSLGGGDGMLRNAAASLADTQRSAVAHRMGIVQVLIVADEEDIN